MDQQKRPYIGYYNHNESQKNFKPRLNLSNQNKIGDIRELSILQTKNKKKKSKKAFSRSENAQILKENWEKEKEEAKRNKEHVDIDVPYEEPWFLRDEYIQDENQRKKTDPNYDPTTLYIPKDEWLKFSPAMYQYWEIKTKHFDKILLFKLGKFYELYNEDAIIAHRILDLNWMRASKRLHVGFPEKVLSKNLTKLVEEGFQCVIVEQCENSRMLQKRLEEQKEISHPVDECAKRAVTCIFTKGTFSDPNNQDYHSRYILVFKHDHENNIGIGFFDVGTLQFFLGRYKDNESFGMFRTIINQIRPVEVIFDRENTQEELVNILKNAALSPLFSTVSPKDCWGIPKTLSAIENYFGENHEEWPEILRKAREDDNSDLMMNAFGMIINYLEKLLIAEQTLPLGAFKEFDPKKSMVTTLVMDSQVVQHLEILEVEKTTQRCREGSLIDYLDRTSTLFGKRMLERWICSPLTDTIKINDRLDCIEDLINNYMLMTNFRTKLKTLPDIEKLLGKLYKYSIKQSVKVVYFENLSVNKIKEFHDLLEHLKSLKGIINIYRKVKDSFKSKRLRALLTFKPVIDTEENNSDDESTNDHTRDTAQNNENSDEGLFPDIDELIQDFESLIVWKADGKEKIPEPLPGIDESFDVANEEVMKIKKELDQHLCEIKDHFQRDDITYIHTRIRYELDIPKDVFSGKKEPAFLELSSSKNNVKRYQTTFIKEMVENLEKAEENLNDAIVPFIVSLFTHFYSKKQLWTQVVSCLAELDCLHALADVSNSGDGAMSRPQLLSYEDNYGKPYLELRKMRHPCVSKTGINFIPNDTVIGKLFSSKDDPEEDTEIILLVTGPNMGGKSTILRQTCIAVIMAQIGCYVPAEKCVMTIVDKIFTRIGASDRILEGKSTFYVEMEETKAIIEGATIHSLSILDELGRGTSTFDGYAIAASVLNHISSSIKCRTMFSTHYHMLVEEFSHDPKIANFHMACKTNKNSDVVTFLYKFIRGQCPKSYGINVARLAQIPNCVLENAKRKSEEFRALLKDRLGEFQTKQETDESNVQDEMDQNDNIETQSTPDKSKRKDRHSLEKKLPVISDEQICEGNNEQENNEGEDEQQNDDIVSEENPEDNDNIDNEAKECSGANKAKVSNNTKKREAKLICKIGKKEFFKQRNKQKCGKKRLFE